MSQATSTDHGVDTAGVSELSSRLAAAWAKNDGDAFAQIFTEDATVLLPGDIFLKSREEIRAFMTQAYLGPYRGTGVTGDPLSVRLIDGDTAVMITYGGVLAPGETAVSAERAIRATWVCVRQDGRWLVSAYQNSPVNLPS